MSRNTAEGALALSAI